MTSRFRQLAATARRVFDLSTKRAARASMTAFFLAFAGALFAGTVFIPQVIALVYPPFSSLMSQGAISFGGVSFSLVGFLLGAVLTFPILFFALKQSKVSTQG